MSGSAGSELNSVFFLFLTLVVGAASRQIISKTRIPYTVFLLCIGFVVGIVARFNDSISSFTEIADLDPHLLLFVFLPLLLFESAFNIEIHVFVKEIRAILLLALPGVLLGTTIVGLVGE